MPKTTRKFPTKEKTTTVEGNRDYRRLQQKEFREQKKQNAKIKENELEATKILKDKLENEKKTGWKMEFPKEDVAPLVSNPDVAQGFIQLKNDPHTTPGTLTLMAKLEKAAGVQGQPLTPEAFMEKTEREKNREK